MTDDHHLLHGIRQARRLHLVQGHTTVPAALAIELPERRAPSWQRPSPRTGRQLAMGYHRTRHTLRAVCRVLPVLIPIARCLA